MPRTAFFADLHDLEALITQIIDSGIGEIFETMSALDEPIRRIGVVDDAHAMKLGSPANKNDLLLLQIVPATAKAGSHFRKIAVNLDGHQGVRTPIEGYVLIQFYLGGVVRGSNAVLESTLGVGTAAGFRKRAVTEDEVRTINEIDWDGVRTAYNSIVKRIEENSEGPKVGAAFVMAGARTLVDSGYETATTF